MDDSRYIIPLTASIDLAELRTLDGAPGPQADWLEERGVRHLDMALLFAQRGLPLETFVEWAKRTYGKQRADVAWVTGYSLAGHGGTEPHQLEAGSEYDRRMRRQVLTGFPDIGLVRQAERLISDQDLADWPRSPFDLYGRVATELQRELEALPGWGMGEVTFHRQEDKRLRGQCIRMRQEILAEELVPPGPGELPWRSWRRPPREYGQSPLRGAWRTFYDAELLRKSFTVRQYGFA